MATRPICSIEGCHKPAKAHGWCGNHYMRFRRNGGPLASAPAKVRMCDQPCSVDGCSDVVGPKGSNGMCGKHNIRVKRHGDPHYEPVNESREMSLAYCRENSPPAGARLIPLTQGYAVIVDERDYEILSRHEWCLQTTLEGGMYASRSRGEKRTLMHREIMECSNADYVDHKNGNGLDNRRSNLRVCQQSQNALNHPGHRKRLSRFKGLHKQKSSGRWVASFRGKYIGIFDCEEDAALAYDRVAYAADPEFAYLNFPERIRCQDSFQE